ncbi:PRAME family member 12-like [Peromyscus maniculatus bairdii]|uniref:PRAME family member 12-like n=1 Tax=Peromyscus maniculatus bairdii TaxID=230844 RepID=UPI003FD62171
MSFQTPPTLEELGRQVLLRNETLAISTLEKLPWTLFPALFKDAFNGGHTRIVKAMVAAWPFPCLPVGTLMKTPNLEIFQALLDGVDMHLKREFHSGCLRNPLATLSITRRHLSQSDLNYFPLSHNLRQLKHLVLRGILLFASCLKPLGVLIEHVAESLQSLDLQGCRIQDSQLTDLIPALSKCSKLTEFNLLDNDFSMPTLKDLLGHTANLTKMNVEQYPAPIQCYNDYGYILVERFAQHCLELMDTLRALRQPKRILFSTDPCHECGERCVYDLGPRLCPCQR